MPEHGQDREVAEFFAIFEEASESLDTGALTGCFAESFMAADPSGAQPVPRSGFCRCSRVVRSCLRPRGSVG